MLALDASSENPHSTGSDRGSPEMAPEYRVLSSELDILSPFQAATRRLHEKLHEAYALKLSLSISRQKTSHGSVM
jgi:hypothetical protein